MQVNILLTHGGDEKSQRVFMITKLLPWWQELDMVDDDSQFSELCNKVEVENKIFSKKYEVDTRVQHNQTTLFLSYKQILRLNVIYFSVLNSYLSSLLHLQECLQFNLYLTKIVHLYPEFKSSNNCWCLFNFISPVYIIKPVIP